MDDSQKLPGVSFNNLDQDSVPMMDHSNQTVIQVPKSDVELALKTGKYTLPKGVEVPVISPDGDLGTISSDRVSEALESGFKLEDATEQHERLLEEQYGDKDLEAGLAGAARSLTFGLSDQALTKTGLVEPKTLSRIEEANPVSSTTGEVVGFGVGLLGPGEIGAAVKGAEAVGKAAERVIAKQFLKSGASQSLAKSIAVKIAPKIAGGAVEGSFYGGGQLLTEEALGRADINAENLVASVGTGALLGGSVGFLSGAAELTMPFAKETAKKIVKPLEDAAEDLTNKTKATAEFLGMTKKEAERVQRTGLSEELPQILKNDYKISKTTTDDELLSMVKARKEAAGTEIGRISEIMEKEGGEKLLAPEAEKVYARIEKNVQDEILSKLEGTTAGKGAAAQVNKILEDYRTTLIGDKALKPISAIEMLKEMRALDDQLQMFYRDPAKAKQSIKALYEVRSVMREEINEMADRVAQVTTNPELGNMLRKANKDFYVATTIQTPLEKKVLQKSGVSLKDIGLSGIGVHGGLKGAIAAGVVKFLDSDLRRKMVILSNIEKSNLEILKSIKNGTANFFKSGGKVADKMLLYKFSDSALTKDENGKKPKDKKEAWSNLQNNLDFYASNPDKLIERTNKKTSVMFDVAPETSAAVDVTTQRAIQFLSSKMPRSAQSQGMMDLLENKKMPSTMDIAKFERYMKAVENPKQVIKDFEKGLLSKEGVEALKVVYPSIYDGLRNNVVNYISENPKKLDYNRKIRLGILLDVPTDASLIPENILGLQSQFTQQAEQQQGIVNPSASGMQNLEISNRSTTPLQDVQNGDE